MNAVLRRLRPRAGRAGAGLVLLLAFAIVVPSACLLWFMKEAVQNERLAVRQKLVNAYRSHLSLAQERLAAYWGKAADQLNDPGLGSRALFAKYVKEDLVDSLIVFDADGRVSYPDVLAEVMPGESSPAWQKAEALEVSDAVAAAESFARLAESEAAPEGAARALQAQARCLLRAGSKEQALKILTGPLAADRLQETVDHQGRFIVPNAELMALELSRQLRGTPDPQLLARLQGRLNDYVSWPLPAAQRRFLMHEVEKLSPGIAFPTLHAEDLASQYLEQRTAGTARPQLRASGLPNVWQVTSRDGRVIALHHTERLARRMQSVIASQALPTDVRLELVAPGDHAERVLFSTPAGADLEGWSLALSLTDPHAFDSTLTSRVSSYVWIGITAVGAMIALGLLALGMIRRQAALTQLRNDLVANVTHELKTPLSSMRLLVDTLLAAETLSSTTAREYLELIARENVRLSRLIDNFLTFSRIERNKYVFNFKEISAQTIAEQAVAAVRERFSVPGCRLEVQVAPNLPSLRADPDAMVTALVNLLDNAWKYSGDDKQITLSSGAQNGHVFFAVRDNGVGLAPREKKRIFKRFYQVQHSAQAGAGCGLGLSIVRFIVTAHEGTVEVESAPDRGSLFKVVLPAQNKPGPQ